MNTRSTLIRGTMLLTAAGMLSRLIGFFYRVFLSNAFGAEAMGIYQLTAPVMALSFSLTAAGLQTAISKYVAEGTADSGRKPHHVLCSGILLSLILSGFCSMLIHRHADFLAAEFLHETRCAPLLRILAFSLPLASLHSCFNGYFYGLKRTKIPASSQILEQLARVGTCMGLYYLLLNQGKQPSIALTVIGMLIGEAVSAIFSVLAAYIHFERCSTILFPIPLRSLLASAKNLTLMALPLSANRIVLNLLQSYEAVQLPLQLQKHGLAVKESLSIYGTLTGMSLPLIMFPNVITGSVSVLLLPIISSAQAVGDIKGISRAIRKCVRYSFCIGLAAAGGFLLSGRFLGQFLFHSDNAGTFLLYLSFLCPFLYCSTTLTSVLHGLGKTGISFVLHLSGLLVRLLSVFLVVPSLGIYGYLWGLLAGEIFCAAACLFFLRRYIVQCR